VRHPPCRPSAERFTHKVSRTHRAKARIDIGLGGGEADRLSTFLCGELGPGSAKIVEAALAQWLGFQAGRATWPLTTRARAENAPELLLDSRTGAPGELGLQRTVAYVSPHRPDHVTSAALLFPRLWPPERHPSLSDARVEDWAGDQPGGTYASAASA
jgi:hypothetical protein